MRHRHPIYIQNNTDSNRMRADKDALRRGLSSQDPLTFPPPRYITGSMTACLTEAETSHNGQHVSCRRRGRSNGDWCTRAVHIFENGYNSESILFLIQTDWYIFRHEYVYKRNPTGLHTKCGIQSPTYCAVVTVSRFDKNRPRCVPNYATAQPAI
jgi:hypothetical protein